jgi:hypothetical protein
VRSHGSPTDADDVRTISRCMRWRRPGDGGVHIQLCRGHELSIERSGRLRELSHHARPVRRLAKEHASCRRDVQRLPRSP